MKNGIKETKTAYLVNLDEYTNRDRYYSGERAGVAYRIAKANHKDLFGKYNDHFSTGLDALLASLDLRDELPDGVTIYRKGYIIG